MTNKKLSRPKTAPTRGMKYDIDASLNNSEHRWFMPLNDFLALLTVISISAIVLETVPSLAKYHDIFLSIEYSATVFFALEYLARLYVAPSKFKYIFSFYGLIDLLSIAPTVMGATNLLFLKSARVLRLLRLLRMMRLAKLARRGLHHMSNSEEKQDSRSLLMLNVQIYIMTLLSAVLICGSLIYVFESEHEDFHSIPLGMLWATEMILGGGVTGQATATMGGHIVSLVARFFGLMLLGVLIGIIGNFARVWLYGEQIHSSRTSRKKTKKPKTPARH